MTGTGRLRNPGRRMAEESNGAPPKKRTREEAKAEALVAENGYVGMLVSVQFKAISGQK